MRSTFDGVTVRLYHLADEPGMAGATTLIYGTLEEAIRLAASQPEEVQAGLFIATDNDVIAWADLSDSL
ncbi:hypothetical protein ACFOD9_08195 [Novosphingobium bradum]|uniref:Uncharacterized protein n=1 Tax=Novosphingobium bradum TaxID=1737444 RepID=A0ABV7INJ5_9SPHN